MLHSNPRCQKRKFKLNHTKPPTIHSLHPQYLVSVYRLGNNSTKASTKHTSQTLTTLRIDDNGNTAKINLAATQVMTIIHEYHNKTTNISTPANKSLPQQTPYKTYRRKA